MDKIVEPLPVVLACAGCSEAGRLAYDVAQALDRQGTAEMSCLAGVAAGLPTFERKLTGRELWVVDGCPLHCALHVVRQQGREPARHLRLREVGVKKNRRDLEPEQVLARLNLDPDHRQGEPGPA